VIKVQFVVCVADPTFPTVPFPHFEFDGRWNDSTALCVQMDRLSKVVVSFHGYELKLVDNPMLITFLPGIHQMKNPIV
jgi:hypothetical protein